MTGVIKNKVERLSEVRCIKQSGKRVDTDAGEVCTKG
jgi:hypothetical protein